MNNKLQRNMANLRNMRILGKAGTGILLCLVTGTVLFVQLNRADEAYNFYLLPFYMLYIVHRRL